MKPPRQAVFSIDTGALDQYDTAYLNGGQEQVFLTAIGTLVRLGVVELNSSERKLLLKQSGAADLHPVESELCNSIQSDGGATVDKLYTRFHLAAGRVRSKLERLSLVPTEENALAARLWPAVALGMVPGTIGVPRLFLGVGHHRPVLYLVVEVISSFILATIALSRPLRTSLGDKVLKCLIDSNQALRVNFSTCRSSLSHRDVALAYALFGGVLAMSIVDPFNAAKAAMRPPSSSSGGCGGSCGGGCGGGCGGCGG